MSYFYRIEEVVSPDYYIVLDGMYTSKKDAEEKAASLGPKFRAVLYRTARYTSRFGERCPEGEE